MSIPEKAALAKRALLTISTLVDFPIEVKHFIINTRASLFEKILAKTDLSDEQREIEINIATVGILVLSLSFHQSRYDICRDINEPPSPYISDAEGFLVPYYPKQHSEVLAISGVNQSTTPDNETDNAYNERLVLAVGTKVMNGELPFQPEILNKIFDKHTPNAHNDLNQHSQVFCPDDTENMQRELSNDIIALKEYVSELSAQINQTPRYFRTSLILCKMTCQYAPRIEAAFFNALNTAQAGNDTPEKKKFMEGLGALKQATLDSFQRKEANFSFDDCTTIADSAFMLAEKVGSNTVTQADVYQFTQATRKYKTSHTFAIALAVIIGAVIGMTAGAAIGFAVGSVVPGAIIGGVAGCVVGGAIAGVSSTMWYTKKEPLNKISSAATEMVPSQPAAGL